MRIASYCERVAASIIFYKRIFFFNSKKIGICFAYNNKNIQFIYAMCAVHCKKVSPDKNRYELIK